MNDRTSSKKTQAASGDSWSQRITRTFARFLGARAGNVALLFGLAALPIMVAGGAAVDFSRAFVVQQRLSAALDATALALGSTTETDPDELEQLAQNYFTANYPSAELGVPGTLNFTIAGATVSMSASAELETTIMKIAGINSVDVSSSVEVTKEKTSMEVVLVLDNTGSMSWNGKIEALKTASTELVNTLFGEEENPEILKVGLVPFAASANEGTGAQANGWMDTNAQNSLHGVQFEVGDNNVFTQYAKFTNKVWNGCVEARPAPHDTSDTPPDPSDPDTLWVPYFAPDEPDSWAAGQNGYWYGNSYLDDEVSSGNTDVDFRQRRVSKYQGESVGSAGPHFNCKNQTLTPLTNSKSTVLAAINNMNATGSTVIPIGLAWGWRVISPTSPFTEGASYDDDTVKKVIILLTDGKNDVGQLGNHNKSWYNGYGYVEQGRLGTTDASAAQGALNTRTGTLCTNIKNAGILVYTITFQVTNQTIINLMRDCASAPSKFFNSPTNGQLQAAFEQIGGELSKLRISK